MPGGLDLEAIDGNRDAYIVRARDDRSLRKLPELELEPISRRRVRVSTAGWSFELGPRHSEIVILMALHPSGLTAEELRTMIDSAAGLKVGTIRAEICRLRRRFDPIISRASYRLKAVVKAGRAILASAPGEPEP